MRLNPLALAITALLASHAFAATPKPLCAEELVGIRKMDTDASGALHGFNDQWRTWLQARVAVPSAATAESVDRWVFALRAWNRLTPPERQTIGGEIGALLAGWDATALESLEKTLSAYGLEVAAARQRLALYVAEAHSAENAATGREGQLRPGPRPGWWAQWWDKTALPAWEDAVRTHKEAEKAVTTARNEHHARHQLDVRLANVEADVKKLLTFVGSLKSSSVDAATHPALGKALADASADQTLALLTAIYLNEGLRLEPKANPSAQPWIDLSTHREKLRQALLEGNVSMPSLPSALGALFATDADVASLEKRLDRILKGSGIAVDELQERLDGIAEASDEAAQELLVEYFEGLSTKIPFGQLAALADVVATVKQANAKELAAIRKYLAENKVTRRNAKSCWVNVRNQTTRAAELAGQQLRVVKLERVLTVLKNPPKRVLRATRTASSPATATSSSSTTSSSDDFFTYYLLWYFLLHDSSPAGVHTAAHYTEPAAHDALDGKPLADIPAVPAVQPDAPAIQPVGDDFGGAKPGDFVPNDGLCGIGKDGDFAPQLDSGISLAGSDTSSATIDFSQMDVGGSSGTGGLDLGTTGGGSYDYGGSSSGSYDYGGSSSSSYDSGSSSYDSGSSSCGGGF